MKTDDFLVTVIDDDETMHYILRTLIKRENPKIAISSYTNALDFLNVYNNRFVSDGILLDINMPRMNGWELLDKLEIEGFNTPVYMFSSSADSRDVARISKYPFVKGYFVKPLTTEKIRELLSQIQKKKIA
jgi:FixJ family two-component response regulator